MTDRTRQQIVFDTSALLSDGEALTAYPDTAITIPLTVIEELDKIKGRMDEVGATARQHVREIEALREANGGLQDPVDLAGGSTLRVKTNGLDRKALEKLGFDVNRPDNRILAACLGVRGELEGAGEDPTVTLITNDAGLRIKASQVGLGARVHALVEVDGEDDHHGHITLEVGDLTTDALFEHNKLPIADLDDDVRDHVERSVVDNEFVVLRAGRSTSVLTQRRDDALVRALSNPKIGKLEPRALEQTMAMGMMLDDQLDIVALDGVAGTGKTLIALAAGLERLDAGAVERVGVFRPMVPVERNEVGYLPGDLDEKLAPWMEVVTDVFTFIEGSRQKATAKMARMQDKGELDMMPVTYLRGRTLLNTWVVVDEAQNLEVPTLKVLLTRLGHGSKIIFTGDTAQIDHKYLSKDTNALSVLMDRYRGQANFGHLTLSKVERSAVAEQAGRLL